MYRCDDAHWLLRQRTQYIEHFDPMTGSMDCSSGPPKTRLYLKLVIEEKNEWIRTHTGWTQNDPDGNN